MDPANEEIIQRVYKKSIRADEERLMLAVLESAVEDFQKYVLVRNPRGKQRFQQAEGWFLKDGEGLFSSENICDTLGPTSRPHTERVDGLGRKRGSKRFLYKRIPQASQAGEQSHRATAHRTEAVWLSSKEL